MAQGPTTVQARREAVQPSLWDRLVDDLPGLVSETEIRRREIGAEIGTAAGVADRGRCPRRRAGAGPWPRQAREVVQFLGLIARRAFLEERGVMVTADVLREVSAATLRNCSGSSALAPGSFGRMPSAGAQEDPQDLLADFPHVSRSVLNYGVPSFSGRRAKDFEPEVLARELKDVVATFEPRLKRDTIRVTVDTGGRDGLKVKIEGVLMLSPVPERLRLSTTSTLTTAARPPGSRRPEDGPRLPWIL